MLEQDSVGFNPSRPLSLGEQLGQARLAIEWWEAWSNRMSTILCTADEDGDESQEQIVEIAACRARAIIAACIANWSELPEAIKPLIWPYVPAHWTGDE